jgi:hypothetical protein
MTRQEYHNEAAACARLAEQTDDPTTRMVSAGLAQAWLQLATLAETTFAPRDKSAEGADKAAAAHELANNSTEPIKQS